MSLSIVRAPRRRLRGCAVLGTYCMLLAACSNDWSLPSSKGDAAEPEVVGDAGEIADAQSNLDASTGVDLGSDAGADAIAATQDAAHSVDGAANLDGAVASPDGTAANVDACTPNECGGCVPLTRKAGAACGRCGSYACAEDKNAVVCIDPGINACGGCGTLAHAPDEACGTCGTYKCGTDGTIACSDPGLNACGVCGTLSATRGAPCGCNNQFQFVCSADGKSLACSDPGANACGGCGALSATPGSSCGQCGTYVCSSNGTLTCNDPGLNACGGCGTLSATPGSNCGQCGQYTCNAAKTAVTCTGATTTASCANGSRRVCQANGNWGAAADCGSGVCMDASRCATVTRTDFGPTAVSSRGEAACIAVTNSGRVAVAGRLTKEFDGLPAASSQDGFLAAFSAALTPRALKSWGTTAGELATSLASLAGDVVVVGGWTTGALYDTVVPSEAVGYAAAWNVAGTPTFVWGTQKLGAGPAVVAADAGRGYVFAFTRVLGDSTGRNIVIQKLSATNGAVSSTQQWTRDVQTDFTVAAVNAAGDIFVVGEVDPDPTTAGPFDAILARFAGGTAAAPVWVRTWGTADADAANGVVVDAAGNIYVAGSTFGSIDGNTTSGNWDAFLTRFDASGTKTWTKQWGTSGVDQVGGIALGPQGELYVVGQTNGAFTSAANGGLSDLFVSRLEADGTLSWTVQSATTDMDTAKGIAVDRSAGIVYAAGSTYRTTTGSYDTAVLKIAPQ